MSKFKNFKMDLQLFGAGSNVGYTRLAEVIQPEIFTDYTIQRTMELSELVQSGVISNDSEFDTLAGGPNLLVHMPYWNDLGNDESQVMKDSGNMVVHKIEAAKDIARKQARVNAWGANGLSALLSGDDPMSAISELVASYWVRDLQRTLLATLHGVFLSTGMTNKVHDITARDGEAGTINARTFIDATQLMGDAKELLTGVMMHSAVEAELRKQDLIEYIPQSEQGKPIPYFLGKRVHVDDAMAFDTDSGVAEMYIFGQGALALGNGSHPRIIPTEVQRNPLSYSGEEALVNRKVFMLHPRGIAWKEPEAGYTDVFPTNTEIKVADRWGRVYEDKAIRIVKFVFNTIEQGNGNGGEGPTGPTAEEIAAAETAAAIINGKIVKVDSDAMETKAVVLAAIKALDATSNAIITALTADDIEITADDATFATVSLGAGITAIVVIVAFTDEEVAKRLIDGETVEVANGEGSNKAKVLPAIKLLAPDNTIIQALTEDDVSIADNEATVTIAEGVIAIVTITEAS